MRSRTAAEYDNQIRQLAKQVISICRPAQTCKEHRLLSLLPRTDLLIQSGRRLPWMPKYLTGMNTAYSVS